MSGFEITKNNKKAILALLGSATEKALEECGLMAQKYAVQKCPRDIGTLRKSIAYKVAETKKGSDMYVGTNMHYAPYVEYGTGQYYSGGRRTPWVYKDAKGDWHRTSGMKAQPFIKPSIADHTSTYQDILMKNFKNS